MASPAVGHIVLGFFFFIVGLWHLFSHTKLYITQPNSYTAFPWFPVCKSKYFELLLIMLATSIYVLFELFIFHQPFNHDGTMSSSHLPNFEHSIISLSFFVYASFAFVLDKFGARFQHGLTYFLASIAFVQELIMFHFHSTDHHGLEGQYHLFLQLIVLTSLATSLFACGSDKSFLISFVRSISILFQGLWLVVIGVMVWTPSLFPKGCFLRKETNGRQFLRCENEEALDRGKSLVNIEFSVYMIGVMVFVGLFYLGMERIYGEEIGYLSINKEIEGPQDKDYINDVESLKIKKVCKCGVDLEM